MTQVLSLLCAIGVIAATGGTAHADAQLWAEGGVSKEVSKRTEVQFTLHMRFDQDISRLTAVLPEASARYRIKKWLRVGGGYRLEYERKRNGEFVLRHRVSADVRFRYEVHPVRFDYKVMLLEQVRPSSNDQFRTVLRNRIDVTYRASKPWTPGVAAEVFHALGDLDQVAYSKLRLTVGVTYERARHAFEVFYRAELHADPADPTFHILGLGYNFEL